MPFIRVETNLPIPDDQAKALGADLSALAARLLGKPEAYVMVHLHADQSMAFAGTDAPLAFVEVKSIGLPAAQTPELSASLSAFLKGRLGIPPDRTYIVFSSVPAELWGWNGTTF